MSQHSATRVHVKTGRSRFCRVLSASLTVSKKLALAGFAVCWGREAMLRQYMLRTRHWEFRYKSVCQVNTRMLFLSSSSIPWYPPRPLSPYETIFYARTDQWPCIQSLGLDTHTTLTLSPSPGIEPRARAAVQCLQLHTQRDRRIRNSRSTLATEFKASLDHRMSQSQHTHARVHTHTHLCEDTYGDLYL